MSAHNAKKLTPAQKKRAERERYKNYGKEMKEHWERIHNDPVLSGALPFEPPVGQIYIEDHATNYRPDPPWFWVVSVLLLVYASVRMICNGLT